MHSGCDKEAYKLYHNSYGQRVRTINVPFAAVQWYVSASWLTFVMAHKWAEGLVHQQRRKIFIRCWIH